MTSIKITNARKELYKIVKQVNETHEPIEIIGKDSTAYLIGEEDWKSIHETLYLLSIPGMRDSIVEGMKKSITELDDKPGW